MECEKQVGNRRQNIQRLKMNERLKWESKSNVLTRLSPVLRFETEQNESAPFDATTGGAIQEKEENKKACDSASLDVRVSQQN